MYYSYDGLERFLSVKGMTKTSLATELGISSKTMAKMSRGEKIADHVLKRIADYFSCSGFGALRRKNQQSASANSAGRKGCEDLRRTVSRAASAHDV